MISVIIPAFNEEKAISATLQSLINQKYSKKFEVIVVDNNSADKTFEKASKFGNKLNLKIIHEPQRGRGNARSTGALRASGDVLAYIDADTTATPAWLSVIEEGFEAKEVVAITGPWKMSAVTGFTKWFMETFQKHSQYPYRIVKGHYYLNGMNMAIKTSAYKKVGGFDINLNAHEDVKITSQLERVGEIKYVNKMRVTTSGRRFKKGIMKGLWDYQKPFLQHFVFGKKKIDLENVR